MKKQNLSEEISRIKGMMKMINEQSFNDNGPSETAKQVASSVIEILYDESYSGSRLFIQLATGDGSLHYHFDVDFSRKSSSSPSSYYSPAEYTDAEYEFTDAKLEVHDYDGNTVLYKGRDFTDVLNVTLSNGQTIEEYLYEKFDERIQIWSDENPDEPDYDDYRDMKDGY